LARTVLSPDEVRRLRALPLGPRERAVVECLWTLRRAEVAALRWDAVEWARGVVYVRGKGDKDALTAMMPEALVALRVWFEATGHPAGGRPVFPGPSGRAISPQRLEQWVREIFGRAALLRPRRACHAFRRTFASRYLEANPEDLVGLKELLRHERLETTLDYVFLRVSVLAPRLARMKL
jgi:integrase